MEDVSPQINRRLFPVKRIIYEIIHIKATVIYSGREVLQPGGIYKYKSQKKWTEIRLDPGNNVEWTGAFNVLKQGET